MSNINQINIKNLKISFEQNKLLVLAIFLFNAVTLILLHSIYEKDRFVLSYEIDKPLFIENEIQSEYESIFLSNLKDFQIVKKILQDDEKLFSIAKLKYGIDEISEITHYLHQNFELINKLDQYYVLRIVIDDKDFGVSLMKNVLNESELRAKEFIFNKLNIELQRQKKLLSVPTDVFTYFQRFDRSIFTEFYLDTTVIISDITNIEKEIITIESKIRDFEGYFIDGGTKIMDFDLDDLIIKNVKRNLSTYLILGLILSLILSILLVLVRTPFIRSN